MVDHPTSVGRCRLKGLLRGFQGRWDQSLSGTACNQIRTLSSFRQNNPWWRIVCTVLGHNVDFQWIPKMRDASLKKTNQRSLLKVCGCCLTYTNIIVFVFPINIHTQKQMAPLNKWNVSLSARNAWISPRRKFIISGEFSFKPERCMRRIAGRAGSAELSLQYRSLTIFERLGSEDQLTLFAPVLYHWGGFWFVMGDTGWAWCGGEGWGLAVRL